MAGRRRRRAPRTAATLLAAAAATAAVLLGAPPAWAHSSLVSGSPAPGATVTSLPSAVRLTFDLPVLPDGAQVVVRGPDGADVQAGAPTVTDTVVTVVVRPSSTPGRYQVGWQLVSVDGFPAMGAYAFALGGTASAGPTDASSAVQEANGGLVFGGGADPAAEPPAVAAPRSAGDPRPVLLAGGAGLLALLVVAVVRRRRAGAAGTLAG